ncbi:MAG: DUF4221 domain-containing protein [Bacteroidales bacterium]|nr:DUF4221 domain-containing protein [Bacteroidales bacterium]
MNRLTIIIGLSAMLLMLSCKQGSGSTEVVSVDANKHLVKENISFSFPLSLARDLLLDGSLGDDTNYYFCDNTKLFKYDVANKNITISYYGNRSSRIATGKADGIWVIHPSEKGICNTNDNRTYPCNDPIPKMGMEYWLVNRIQMPIIGNSVFCSVLANVDDFDMMPKISKWRIEDDRLSFDTLFGDFPASYDYGNFALGHMSEFIYNPYDSILILSSGLMDTVSIYNLEGKFLKNVYLGSQHKKPIKKLTLEGLQKQSEAIQWQRQNNYYCKLIYDPWREVYLRTFHRPCEDNSEGIVRENSATYTLVVADRSFRIKYEVIFDNPDYRAGYFILPMPEGVYILKQKDLYDDENMQIDLFLFD